MESEKKSETHNQSVQSIGLIDKTTSCVQQRPNYRLFVSM